MVYWKKIIPSIVSITHIVKFIMKWLPRWQLGFKSFKPCGLRSNSFKEEHFTSPNELEIKGNGALRKTLNSSQNGSSNENISL
jgi:hypothetical protein